MKFSLGDKAIVVSNVSNRGIHFGQYLVFEIEFNYDEGDVDDELDNTEDNYDIF